MTTDHISPAGDIAEDSPAGRYLKSKGVAKKDFNSYGSRRGNDRVMVRGTFANIRLKNLMVPGRGGRRDRPPARPASGWPSTTRRSATGRKACRSWSSRARSTAAAPRATGRPRARCCWACARCIAESYERIHRSNLVGMGVLPLQFKPGQNAETLGLTGREALHDRGASRASIRPRQDLTVEVGAPRTAARSSFAVIARLDTPVEINYYRNGGILHTVLRKMLKG